MPSPYKPKYTGFDVDETRRAQETAERAQKTAGAQGEDANKEYVDDGPAEAARRSGSDAKSIGDAVERARKKR